MSILFLNGDVGCSKIKFSGFIFLPKLNKYEILHFQWMLYRLIKFWVSQYKFLY